MTIKRIEITGDEQWHELRAGNIGASEIAALFGIPEFYTSAYALSAQKLGLLQREGDNEAMERGRILEPLAADLLKARNPDWFFEKPSAYYCDEKARIGATPDLFVYRDEDVSNFGIIEIKSVEPGVFARTWHDEDGELALPPWVRLQVHQEAHLTGAAYAYVAALVIGHGVRLELIEVPLDPVIIERIHERAALFWEAVDAGKTMDPDYSHDGEAIAAVLRQDDETELDMTSDNELPTIAAKLEAAQHSRKMADDMVKEMKAKIMHRIGPAAKVRFAGGTISAKTVHRKEYTVPASSYRSMTVRFAKNRFANINELTSEEAS